MATPSSPQLKLKTPAPTKQSTKKSVMREYLESNDPALNFEYPSGGNHYDFGAKHQTFLVSKSKISVKPEAKASVYSYRRNTDLETPLTFEPDVIVKQIRGNIQNSNTNALKEVRVQQYLYHPHITAFLGTFTMHERLNIVIYPVACGDLGDFMREVCDDLHLEENTPGPLSPMTDPVSHVPGELPIRRDHSRNNSRNNKEISPTANNFTKQTSTGPFPWLLVEKMQKLRSWFACLCAALQYLHETGVRHKDIKPANIVIDSSGSALLTDFGIARLFPPGIEHVTNDQWDHTPEYASPEMMKGRDEKRSDPSDVFSLGCVFVEMATVLLRGDLEDFSDFRAREGSTKYHKSLPNVYEWISHGCAPSNAPRRSHENSTVFNVLPDIRRMLAEIPEERPLTKDLWGIFKDVSIDRCPDCDFRLDEDTRWTPSADQIRKTQEAFNQRSTLLGAETLHAPLLGASGGLPTRGSAPSSRAEHVTDHGAVYGDENYSDASSLVGPVVMVRAPTALTDTQVPLPYPRDPLVQQTEYPQVHESANSSGVLNTVTPISYDSGGSNSTLSSEQHTLVYCVKERTLRIQKFNSIDPSRRKELCLLPHGRIVVISSLKGDVIARVDLGKIEDTWYYTFWFRRQFGQFPHVCVLFERPYHCCCELKAVIFMVDLSTKIAFLNPILAVGTSHLTGSDHKVWQTSLFFNQFLGKFFCSNTFETNHFGIGGFIMLCSWGKKARRPIEPLSFGMTLMMNVLVQFSIGYSPSHQSHSDCSIQRES